MKYKRVLILGPDMKSSFALLKSQFQDQSSLIIGNGDKGIDINDLHQLKDVEDKALIFIFAHGNTHHGDHIIDLFNKDLGSSKTSQILERIFKITGNKKVNLHIHSCLSGALKIQDVKNLPDNSSVICFADEKDTEREFLGNMITYKVRKEWNPQEDSVGNISRLFPILYAHGDISIFVKSSGIIESLKLKLDHYTKAMEGN